MSLVRDAGDHLAERGHLLGLEQHLLRLLALPLPALHVQLFRGAAGQQVQDAQLLRPEVALAPVHGVEDADDLAAAVEYRHADEGLDRPGNEEGILGELGRHAAEDAALARVAHHPAGRHVDGARLARGIVARAHYGQTANERSLDPYEARVRSAEQLHHLAHDGPMDLAVVADHHERQLVEAL